MPVVPAGAVFQSALRLSLSTGGYQRWMAEASAPRQAPPASVATEAPSVLSEISREIVKVHSHHYGRGPTKARTVWRDDLVVVILEGAFTRAEQTLVDGGHFDQVRGIRQTFQDQVSSLFCQIIEEATNRKVRSFLSQVNPDGVAAEVFVLERED